MHKFLLAVYLILNFLLVNQPQFMCNFTPALDQLVIWFDRIWLLRNIFNNHRFFNLRICKRSDRMWMSVIFHDTGLKFNCDLLFLGEKHVSLAGQLIHIGKIEVFYILFKAGEISVRTLDPFYLQTERGFNIPYCVITSIRLTEYPFILCIHCYVSGRSLLN